MAESITWLDVASIAPDLCVPYSVEVSSIEIANLFSPCGWPSSAIRIARSYLAAHSAQTSSAGTGPAGPVTSESVGGVSRSYASPSGGYSTGSLYGSTQWGRLFLQLQQQFAGIGMFVT